MLGKKTQGGGIFSLEYVKSVCLHMQTVKGELMPP